jgi:nucleotide-binding universal stress UspA family protein
LVLEESRALSRQQHKQRGEFYGFARVRGSGYNLSYAKAKHSVLAAQHRKGGKMYQKILVPLDGSKLAECVLPYVEEIATGCRTEQVILVSVTERIMGYRVVEDYTQPSEERLVPEAVGKEEKQAQKYLGKIAKTLEAKGIKVLTEVLLGNPAEEIAIYADTKGCDLIIMASHGRSGPSRWAHGSVAEKVFRASCVPVLMVRAPGCAGTI